MTNGLQINESTAFAGLGTLSFTAVTAGPYTVSFKSFIPYIASGMPGDSTTTTGGSGLQVVINLNASAKLTIGSPSPTQQIMGGKVNLALVAGDVVTVVLTSSNAVDSGLNAPKTIVNLYQGE